MNRADAEYIMDKTMMYRWARKSVFHALALTVARFLALPLGIALIIVANLYQALIAAAEEIGIDLRSLNYKGCVTIVHRDKDTDKAILEAQETLSTDRKPE